MYGDAFLYFPAILHLCGLSVTASYKVFVLLVNVFTASTAYYAFSRIFANKSIGVIASLLWTLSLYRLECIYLRAAVGEYSALSFLPLVALGIVYIFSKDIKPSHYGWDLCSMGACGVIFPMY